MQLRWVDPSILPDGEDDHCSKISTSSISRTDPRSEQRYVMVTCKTQRITFFDVLDVAPRTKLYHIALFAKI